MTKSYLNMDKAVTGCQNTESKDKCNSRRFLAGLQSLCGCVPLAGGEVGQAGVDLALVSPDQGRLCGPSDQACVSQVPLQYQDCLPRCEGLSISNSARDSSSQTSRLEDKLAPLMAQYNRYKNLWDNTLDFPANLKGLYLTTSFLI